MGRTFLWVVLALAMASSAVAQPVVFVVRHAERADAGAGGMMMAADPELSPAGRQRAAALASMLRDAGLTAVLATEFKRTIQTAEPAARAAGLTVTALPSKDLAALVRAVDTAKGHVLVVGHSNTLPDIIRALGVDANLAIADSEYDNLFVVIRGPKPALLRLHFQPNLEPEP